MRPGRPDSFEGLFHEVGIPRFLLNLRDEAAAEALAEERLERAIGVIYAPRTERQSHYFGARTAAQFDVVLHYDVTSAVHPLDPPARWPGTEPPETFPSGL